MRIEAAGTASTVAEFIGAIAQFRREPRQETWYRGHSRKDWRLQPKLDRPPARKFEREAIDRFRQDGAPFLDSPNPPWSDVMMAMQHYGAPTRLLDWSENALVGLYFAVSDERQHDTDGAVWLLDPYDLNRMQNFRRLKTAYVPFLDDGQVETMGYAPHTLKPDHAAQGPLAVLGTRNTVRIRAQKGVFTIFDSLTDPLEDFDDGTHVWRIDIPAGAKPEMLQSLKDLGIHEFTLFPELERVGKSITQLIERRVAEERAATARATTAPLDESEVPGVSR